MKRASSSSEDLNQTQVDITSGPSNSTPLTHRIEENSAENPTASDEATDVSNSKLQKRDDKDSNSPFTQTSQANSLSSNSSSNSNANRVTISKDDRAPGSNRPLSSSQPSTSSQIMNQFVSFSSPTISSLIDGSTPHQPQNQHPSHHLHPHGHHHTTVNLLEYSNGSPLSVASTSEASVLSPQSPGSLPLTSAYACLMSRAAKNCSPNNPASPLVCDDSGYSPPPSPPPPHIADWLTQFSQFPLSDKHTALDRLLGTCNFDQLRYMYAVIEPQFQFDLIAKLPHEVALRVFRYLSPRDLCSCALVCQRWRIVADDDLLWREKCRESGLGIQHNAAMVSSSLPSGSGSVTAIEGCSPDWKSVCLKDAEVEFNWRTMNSSKSWSVHDNHVITCLQLHKDKIVCGSDDCSVSIWDVSGSERSKEQNNDEPMEGSKSNNGDDLNYSGGEEWPVVLIGHQGGVWSCEVSGDKVVSGSTDRTLKVWGIKTGELFHTLQGHTSTVRCIALHDNIAISGARDATLRVWNLDNGQELGVLSGHLAAVRCVAFDGSLIISGAYDCFVKVWDFSTLTCLHTLEGHSQRVYSLQFDGVHIVSGSLDASIIVWNAQEGRLVHILRGHRSLTSSMIVKNNMLISGNADSTVKVWDIKSGQCIHTLQCGNKHSSAVTGLQFCRRGKYIVSASDDGTVKLWNVISGEFVRDLLKLETSGQGGVVWRIKCNEEMLVCAVGSRNLSEDTKLIVFDFRAKRVR